MADHDPISQSKATNRAGERCGRLSIPGGSVCRYHSGAAPRLRQPLRPVSGPWLTRLWVSWSMPMKRKDKDLRGALQAAKEVLDRAKPEGEGDGLERSGLVVEYVRQKD
jgi:hypothetical protein